MIDPQHLRALAAERPAARTWASVTHALGASANEIERLRAALEEIAEGSFNPNALPAHIVSSMRQTAQNALADEQSKDK